MDEAMRIWLEHTRSVSEIDEQYHKERAMQESHYQDDLAELIKKLEAE